MIGDDADGVYVRRGIPELIRDRALPLADIITPNQFELAHLTGMDCTTLAGAKAAVAALQARGPRTVLVTSLRTESTPPDAIDLLAAEAGAMHLLRTPLLPIDGQRRGRRDRGAVPAAPDAQRQRGRGLGGCRRRRCSGSSAGRPKAGSREILTRRRTGRIRQPDNAVSRRSRFEREPLRLPLSRPQGSAKMWREMRAGHCGGARGPDARLGRTVSVDAFP